MEKDNINADTPDGEEGMVDADVTEDSGDFEAFEEDFGDGSELVQLQQALEQAESNLARARAETYNVQQDYSRYVKRSKADARERREEGRQDVIEILLPVLDDIEAARAAGDLDGPFASIAEKLEDTLATNYGLERFGEAGEEFDPQRHDALMANPNPDVEEPTINQVLQSGIKIGDRVLRAAKVMVDTPS